MTALLTLALIIAVISFSVIYSSFAWGFVLQKFWYWFLLPVFPTMPHITFMQAVGLMFIIDLFKNQIKESVKDELKDERGLSATAQIFINPIIVWLCGWLIFSIIH